MPKKTPLLPQLSSNCLQGVCFVPPKILFRKTVNLDAVASNELASSYLVSFSISLVVALLLLVS